MSNDESPVSSPPAKPPMPRSVRVATIAMALLAALFLSYGILLGYQFDTVVTNTVGDGDTVTRAEAEAFTRTSLILFVVLGVLLALSAWFLPRRQPWARWLGLAASTLLVLINLLSFVTAGGITILTLVVLALAIAAVTSLLARTTAEYVPRLRNRA